MRFVTLGEAITSFYRDQGFEVRVKQADVFRLWKNIVGEAIAENAKPERFDKDILFVKVKNSAWRNELRYMSEDIRRKINELVGAEIVAYIVLK